MSNSSKVMSNLIHGRCLLVMVLLLLLLLLL